MTRKNGVLLPFFASEVAGGLAVGGGLFVLVLRGGGVLHDELTDLDLRVKLLATAAAAAGDVDGGLRLVVGVLARGLSFSLFCLFVFVFVFEI